MKIELMILVLRSRIVQRFRNLLKNSRLINQFFFFQKKRVNQFIYFYGKIISTKILFIVIPLFLKKRKKLLTSQIYLFTYSAEEKMLSEETFGDLVTKRLKLVNHIQHIQGHWKAQTEVPGTAVTKWTRTILSMKSQKPPCDVIQRKVSHWS